MKATHTLGGSVALAAAMLGYWIAHKCQKTKSCAEQNRFTQDAIQTFESEGGLVLS